MRKYGAIPCCLWQDQRITRRGKECVVLSVYLLSSPHGNLINLYYLPTSYIVADTGLSVESIKENLDHLVKIGFCQYDPDSEFVWMRDSMIRELGETLQPADKRIRGIKTLLEMLPNVAMVQQFKHEFGFSYGLLEKGASMPPCKGAYMEPSEGGLEGACKGGSKPVTVTVAGQSTRKQEQQSQNAANAKHSQQLRKVRV